ncbi:MAG: ABC transporter permease [Candidatus Carbobacillus sp.]|nr:ABC transporter permease [Candidatus Carbobacillus sp.]
MTRTLKWTLLAPYMLWLVVFVIIPIALIAWNSFFDLEGRLTLDNFVRFFSPTYLKMSFISIWYAFLITFISLLVAYPTAYVLSRTRHKQLLLLLIILPSWVNLLLKTYAFMGIFGMYGLVNAFLSLFGIPPQEILFTDFSFIFVSVYIFIPFMILPIYNAMEEMPRGLIEAAQDLGASQWTVLRRVIWPLTLDGVKTGIQAVFIPSLSLFMITRLIAGNRVITLGTAIEQHFLVTQDWGMGATIAVVLVAMMVLTMRFAQTTPKA